MRVPRQILFLLFLTALTGCTYTRAPEPYTGPSGYGGQVISSAPYPSAPPAGTYAAPAPVYSAPAGTNATLGSLSGPSASDSAAVSRIQRTFRTSELAGIAPNINVSAQNGTVTLTGFVSSEHERQMAETLARSAGGVLNVNNELDVVGSPTGRIAPVNPASGSSAGVAGNIFNLRVQGLNATDRAVADRVLDGLRDNPSVMSAFPSVNINVADGRVTLDGQVGTEEQRQAIESAVKQAAGAANVEDHLQVIGVAPARSP